MTVGVRLPEGLEKRLDHLARETNRTKTFYVKMALESFLENQEDYFLSLAVKERAHRGDEKTYSLSESKKNLDRANKNYMTHLQETLDDNIELFKALV